jgi:hypothetical protein
MKDRIYGELPDRIKNFYSMFQVNLDYYPLAVKLESSSSKTRTERFVGAEKSRLGRGR